MIEKPRSWRSMKQRPAIATAGAMWCVYAVALVSSGNLSAQSSAAEGWPDYPRMRWERLDSNYPRLEDEPAHFDTPFAIDRGEFNSPVVTLHELSHRVPGRAAKEYELALKATKKGDNENTIAHLNKAIAVDPEFCAAMNNLGVAYLESDRLAMAVEQFTKAIGVDPHASRPHENLALAYLRQGLLKDAERTARRAADLDRVNPHPLLVLGVSLVLEGTFTTEADRSLRRAADEYPQAKIWLAVGLIGRGDIASAKEQLRTYVGQASDKRSKFAARLLQQLETEHQRLTFQSPK
jgi:Flp pilus assembly protein TadD